MTPKTAILRRDCAVDAKIVAVDAIGRDHVRIEIELSGFPESQPGQFLEIRCHFDSESAARALEWPKDGFPPLAGPMWDSRTPYLRRPFSIADRIAIDDNRASLAVISRNIGPGTDYLDRLAVGDELNVSGPLGTGFQLPTDDRTILLVGGGVGIPPLLYASRALAARREGRSVAIFGATTAEYLPLTIKSEPTRDGAPSMCVSLPGDAPFPSIITTDDGTRGLRGRVTDGIARWIECEPPTDTPLVLACGPEGMLHAVARQTRALGWDCQLCIEKNMGCGLGTCLSCVARVVDASKPAGWRWALTCTEGPVFPRDELVEFR